MLFPFLQNHGVLGINARNLLYVKPFNPRKAVAFADDKMKTKAFLSARGVPAARLFARIENRRQLHSFDFSTLPDECVLKPNYGFGGEGIIILKGRKNGEFLEQGKTPISDQRLREHIEDILDGKFSVNGRNDTAFFEQILVAHEGFLPFRPAGLPDIRIIVFNLVPVMAMLRIPTAVSSGKANVHLGGIGIGIDIAKGVTTHAAQYNNILSELPHGLPVAGIEIPYWDELLLIASRIQYNTNIGYLAADLTIDRELGPVLLEVNARAGLMVQVANLAPLRSRLERVAGLSVSTPEKGVRLARELFGEKIEEHRGALDEEEKPVLGTSETIEIVGDGFTVREACAIATDIEETCFHPTFIDELKAKGALEPVEDAKDSYRVKFTLARKKIQTIVHTCTHDGTRVTVGRRDLAGFLIDPSKKASVGAPQIGMKKDLRALDSMLCDIDKDLPLLKFLKPLNLDEELSRLRADGAYEPLFLQRELPDDIDEMEEILKKMESDETPLGILCKKKRRELLLKIELLRARGNSNKFTAASLALYGAPSPALIGFAETYTKNSEPPAGTDAEQEKTFTAVQAKEEFEQSLKDYGLYEWQVIIRASMVADCAVGEKRVFVREGATFTASRLASLIAHEIETHALTAENGAAQPYDLFRRGFANYLDTQEGLAIYNQIRVLPEFHEKRYLHAKSVLAVAHAMEHSFAETRRYLEAELGMSPEKALMKTLDLKRGFTRGKDAGAFTKTLVYFRGYRAIEQFAAGGGDMKQLYVGKIAIEDLPLVAKMPEVQRPLILPKFLRNVPESPVQKPRTRRSPRAKK